MGFLSCPFCCRQKFDNVIKLREHLLYFTHRPLQCEICSHYFNGIQMLTSHLELHIVENRMIIQPSSLSDVCDFFEPHGHQASGTGELCPMPDMDKNMVSSEPSNVQRVSTYCLEDVESIEILSLDKTVTDNYLSLYMNAFSEKKTNMRSSDVELSVDGYNGGKISPEFIEENPKVSESSSVFYTSTEGRCFEELVQDVSAISADPVNAVVSFHMPFSTENEEGIKNSCTVSHTLIEDTLDSDQTSLSSPVNYVHKKFHHDVSRNGSDANNKRRHIQNFQSIMVQRLNRTEGLKSDNAWHRKSRCVQQPLPTPFPVKKASSSAMIQETEPSTPVESSGEGGVEVQDEASTKLDLQLYSCKYCSKSFVNWFSKCRHEKRHRGDKLKKCPKCKKVFTKAFNVKRHILEVHADKTLTCMTCSKAFPSESMLSSHACEYRCHHCPHQCKSLSGIKAHVRSKHSKQEKTELQCTECKETFTRKYALIRHTQRKHKKRDFICYICDKACSCKEDLKKHLDSHRAETWNCDHCDKVYTSKFALKRHLGSHKKNDSFACDMCSEKFTRLDSLQMHLKLHFGKKTFRCHCGKSFMRKCQLTQHKYSHDENPKFQCQWCNKHFKFKVSLKNHSCKSAVI